MRTATSIGLRLFRAALCAVCLLTAPACGVAPADSASDPCAQYVAAMALLNPKTGDPKFEEAAGLLRAAAWANEHRSQHALGTLYLRGWGVPRDPAQGYAWISIAAQPGDGRAAAALAELSSKLGPAVTRAGGEAAKSLKAKVAARPVRCKEQPGGDRRGK